MRNQDPKILEQRARKRRAYAEIVRSGEEWQRYVLTSERMDYNKEETLTIKEAHMPKYNPNYDQKREEHLKRMQKDNNEENTRRPAEQEPSMQERTPKDDHLDQLKKEGVVDFDPNAEENKDFTKDANTEKAHTAKKGAKNK